MLLKGIWAISVKIEQVMAKCERKFSARSVLVKTSVFLIYLQEIHSYGNINLPMFHSSVTKEWDFPLFSVVI